MLVLPFYFLINYAAAHLASVHACGCARASRGQPVRAGCIRDLRAGCSRWRREESGSDAVWSGQCCMALWVLLATGGEHISQNLFA